MVTFNSKSYNQDMSDTEEQPEAVAKVSKRTAEIDRTDDDQPATIKTPKHVAPSATETPDEQEDDEEDGGWIGPMPTEAVPVKKRKGILICFCFSNKKLCLFCFFAVLDYEKLYLENLPDAECYEKSYMHRDIISHVVATRTDFVITASIDGHVKFWKKQEEGIEFVKHFRSHLSWF